MKRLLGMLILFGAVSTAYAALPGNGANGKKLHDANCLSCHDSSVYTRTDRKMQSVTALREQMTACSHAAQQNLSAEQKQDLVKYLNEQFYKFR